MEVFMKNIKNSIIFFATIFTLELDSSTRQPYGFEQILTRMERAINNNDTQALARVFREYPSIIRSLLRHRQREQLRGVEHIGDPEFEFMTQDETDNWFRHQQTIAQADIISYAIGHASPEIAQTLINAGFRDARGQTALELAMRNNNHIRMQALITAGANPNEINRFGQNLLHIAANTRVNPAIVNTLVAAGTDLFALDNHGQLPAEIESNTWGLTNLAQITMQHAQAQRRNNIIARMNRLGIR